MIALELAWTEVKNLVFSIVNGYVRAFNLNKEEAECNAALAFVLAFNDYRPEQGKLDTWVGTKVKWAMEDMKRERATQRKFETIKVSVPEPPVSKFNLAELMETLSPDARRAVRLVLKSPTTVELSILLMGGPSINNLRRAVKEFMRESGWTWKRIRESFDEVREAL